MPKPLAGAELFVPEKPPADKDNTAQIFGTIAQVIASVVTVIVVAIR